MASLNSDDIRKQLKNKLGCVEMTGDYYFYTLHEGGKIIGRTKVSLGAKHIVGDVLIGKMTRQIGLGTAANFVGMVSCSKSKDECLAVIKSISAQSS